MKFECHGNLIQCLEEPWAVLVRPIFKGFYVVYIDETNRTLVAEGCADTEQGNDWVVYNDGVGLWWWIYFKLWPKEKTKIFDRIKEALLAYGVEKITIGWKGL